MTDSYPISLKYLLSKVKPMQYSEKHSWESLYQMQQSPEDLMQMLQRNAIQNIANQLATKLMNKSTIDIRDEVEYKSMIFYGYCFNLHELKELLYAAYREGQSDLQKFSPKDVVKYE